MSSTTDHHAAALPTAAGRVHLAAVAIYEHLTGPERVEERVAQLDDHDRYGVYVEYIDDEDPDGDVPGRLVDAPGRYAAAMIAGCWAVKGFPIVKALRKVADLSAYDDPAKHPRRPFGGYHCARCAAYARRKARLANKYRAADEMWRHIEATR
jgi:hypothetical protein